MALDARLAALIAQQGADYKDHETRLTTVETKVSNIAPSIVLVEGASTAAVPNGTVIYFREA